MEAKYQVFFSNSDTRSSYLPKFAKKLLNTIFKCRETAPLKLISTLRVPPPLGALEPSAGLWYLPKSPIDHKSGSELALSIVGC